MTDYPEAVREYERYMDECVGDIAREPADAAIAALKAEVERLKWMLREVYGDWVDGESYESWLADLARRWEERHE